MYFNQKKINNKINRLHERCLCIEYNNSISAFDESLELDNSISIHLRQCLVIELYNTFNNISPDIISH